MSANEILAVLTKHARCVYDVAADRMTCGMPMPEIGAVGATIIDAHRAEALARPRPRLRLVTDELAAQLLAEAQA